MYNSGRRDNYELTNPRLSLVTSFANKILAISLDRAVSESKREFIDEILWLMALIMDWVSRSIFLSTAYANLVNYIFWACTLWDLAVNPAIFRSRVSVFWEIPSQTIDVRIILTSKFVQSDI